MYALSLKSKKLVSVAWLLCGLFVNIQKAFAGDVVSQNFFGNTGGGGSGSQYAVCDNDGWTKNGNTSAVTCYGHVYRNPELGGRNTLGYDDYIQQTFPLSAESGYFDMTVYVTALRTWPHGSHFEIWADDVRVYESAEIDMWDLRTCRWSCGGWTHAMGVFTEDETGCTDPSGAYVFNIQFAHASAAKEVTIKITTTGLTVNNPGYYYDSWWSLNTFAYTYYAATVTSAFSDGLTVFDREFDFDIKVASGVCDFDTTDCFQTENYHSTNSAKGLSCAVKVTKTLNEDGSAYASGCSTYSNELPCMQWNDFIDTTKASDYVYSLSTEDSSGSLMAGTYDITYECSWTLSGSQVSNTGEQHLLTFSIFHGCDDYLPTTAGVRVQDIFLLSSPEFLVAKAGSVDIVKENVFRSFDTNPLDGTLSYDELKTALETHDVDTGYLEKLNAQGGIGNGVMLSDVMNSATLPFDQTSKTSKVYIDSIVYPKDSTYSDAVCTQNNEKVSVSWDYTSVPSDASDIMCIYVDGRLFSEHVGSDTGGIPFSLSDERPSSGTGDYAVTLVAHFTFDAEQVTNIASSALSASTGPSSTSGYENFESCDPGGYCLKASTASTGYDYEDANSMANSAVMTWLYRHGDLDGSNTASDVIYAMSATDAANSFSFVFELDQSRLLNAGYKKSGSVSSANDVSVSIASSSSLTTGEWHHVAFVSNSKFGLTIYADGANVGNIAMTSWSTAYMDMLDMYATKTLMHSVYTAIDFTYDDLRIYTGILSDLHVNSIYVCGREAYCTTSMAEAKPQSRRTYCPVIKYSSDGSSASACATGLYYDGLAIDVTISASTKGAVFSFRDSALYESAFEVRRREIVSGTALYDTYDSVVLIDSDLSGCSKTFNSLTFYDSLAMATPGSVWEYLITTKYGDVNTMTVDSDPVTFTVPWYGIAEGSVVAGKSDVPVANIRVCARLISSTTVSSISVGTLSGTSLSTFASNRYVEHSNGTQSSSAYMATDDFPSTSVELASEEWIRVDLNNFISVTQVDVKIKGDLYTASTLDVRVLDYDNEDDAGDSGMRCVESANDPIASTSTSGISYLEITYKCTGTHVGAFPGRYITVLSTTDVGVTMDISNVAVTGEEIECPYTSFSDDDGNYEIEIEEESGATSKNAKVGVMAFKTVVFDRSESTLFQTVANDTDTSIVEPDAVLIALEYDATGLTASLGSTSALGNGLYLPCDSEVDEDGYFLVFRHDSSTGLYFSDSDSFAEVKHTGDSSADYKYSRLDEVETYGKSDDGTYEFKLVYPAYDGWTNIWKQTSNPVTMTSRGVEGYEAISIGATSSYTFKGLEYNLGSSAFIDGVIDVGTWWYAIGSFQSFGNNKIPGPFPTQVSEVKLYVKTTGEVFCPPPPPPPPPSPLSPVTDDVFFSAIVDCLDTNPVDGLCTDSEYGPMPDWDVSQVTDMSSAFLGRTTFNADISQWNTSSATTTFIMFKNAAAFNQDISGWDVSSVVTMRGMFNMQNVDTSAFNQDIGGWDTSQVTNMKFMFYSNEIFDQDVSGWTGSAATSAQSGMFNGATAFQAKYECTAANTGPASSCDTITATTSAKLGSSQKLGSSNGTKDASFLSPSNKNTAYYIVVAAAFAFGMVASQMMASFTRDKSNRFVRKEAYRESAAEEYLVPLRSATKSESSAANAAYGSSDDGGGVKVVGAVL